MGKAALGLLVLAMMAGCSAEPPTAGSNAAGNGGVKAAEGGGAGASALAKPGEGPPRLARVRASPEGDAAALSGRLETAGQCIYVNADGRRMLIASAVEGARWDAADGVLLAGGARLRPGTEVFLGGSSASAASLREQWVEPPAAECSTSSVWVASTIKAR